MKNYTHKEVPFTWAGGLKIYVPSQWLPLPPRQCNGVLYWQLNKSVRLSINQLKNMIEK